MGWEIPRTILEGVGRIQVPCEGGGVRVGGLIPGPMCRARLRDSRVHIQD